MAQYTNSVPVVTYAGYLNAWQVEVTLVYEGKSYYAWVETLEVDTLYFPDEENMPEWFLTISDEDLQNLIEEISAVLHKGVTND